MSCPHSNSPGSSPARCSMCLSITPRLVKIVAATTIMADELSISQPAVVMIDETPIRTVELAHDNTPRRSRTFRDKSERRCGLCGKLGHTRVKCDEAS